MIPMIYLLIDCNPFGIACQPDRVKTPSAFMLF